MVSKSYWTQEHSIKGPEAKASKWHHIKYTHTLKTVHSYSLHMYLTQKSTNSLYSLVQFLGSLMCSTNGFRASVPLGWESLMGLSRRCCSQVPFLGFSHVFLLTLSRESFLTTLTSRLSISHLHQHLEICKDALL